MAIKPLGEFLVIMFKHKKEGVFFEEDLYYPSSPPNYLAPLDLSSDDDDRSSFTSGHSSFETSLIDGHFSQGTSLDVDRLASKLSHLNIKGRSSSGYPRRASERDKDSRLTPYDEDYVEFGQQYHNTRNGLTANGSIDPADCDGYYTHHYEDVECLLLLKSLPFYEKCNIRFYPKTQQRRIYLGRDDELLYRSLDLLYRIIWSTFDQNDLVKNNILGPAPISKYRYYIITIFLLKLVDYTRNRHDFRNSFDSEEDIPQCDEFYIPVEMNKCLLSVLHTLQSFETSMLEDICLALTLNYNVPVRIRHVFGLSPRLIFISESYYNAYLCLDDYRKRHFRLFSIPGPNGWDDIHFPCKFDETSILGRIRYSQGFMDYMSGRFQTLRQNNVSILNDGFKDYEGVPMGADSETLSNCPQYVRFLQLLTMKGDRHAIFGYWRSAMLHTIKNELYYSYEANYEERSYMSREHRTHMLRWYCKDIRTATMKLKMKNTRPDRITQRMVDESKEHVDLSVKDHAHWYRPWSKNDR